jgi:hypothetical protein
MKKISGNWFTDMIRDNFFMLSALVYSAPMQKNILPTPTSELDFLFGTDSTLNTTNIEESLDSIQDDVSDMAYDIDLISDTLDDFDYIDTSDIG